MRHRGGDCEGAGLMSGAMAQGVLFGSLLDRLALEVRGRPDGRSAAG
jgi:hypothetical protein